MLKLSKNEVDYEEKKVLNKDSDGELEELNNSLSRAEDILKKQKKRRLRWRLKICSERYPNLKLNEKFQSFTKKVHDFSDPVYIKFDKEYSIKYSFKEVIEKLKEIEKDSSNFELNYKKGILFLKVGRYKSAVEVFQKAYEINKTSVEVLYQKGRAYYKLENYVEAIKVFDEVLKLDPSDIKAKKYRLRSLIALGQYCEVLDEKNPDMEYFQIYKGLAEGGLERYKDSHGIFEKMQKEIQEKMKKSKESEKEIKNREQLEEEIKNREQLEEIDINISNKIALALRCSGKKDKCEEANEVIKKALKQNIQDSNTWYTKGLILCSLKEYWKAISAFDKAIAIEPYNAPAWLSKGFSYFKLRKNDAGSHVFENFVKFVDDCENDCKKFYSSEETNIMEDADLLDSKGFALLALEKYEEAAEVFGKALELNKNYVIASNFQGIAFFSLRNYDKALKCFENTIKIYENLYYIKSINSFCRYNPICAVTYYYKGLVLYQSRKCDKAIEAFKKSKEIFNSLLLKYGETAPDILYQIGLVYYELKEYKEAIDAFEKAFEIKPSNLDALNNKGLVQYERKMYGEAVKTFEKAIENDKKDPEFRNNKAIVLAKMKCCDYYMHEALKECEQAVKLDPKNNITWIDKGTALYFLEEYDKAIDAFNRAIKLNKKNPEAWVMKGLVLFKLESSKEYEAVYECFEKALIYNPKDVEILNMKGIMLYRLNRPSRAREAFSEAREIDPDDVLTHTNLGWIFLNFGNIEDADSEIDKILVKKEKEEKESQNKRIPPKNTREYDVYAGRMGWAYCLKGQIMIEKRSYDTALENFEEALKWENTSSLFLLWHAYARYLKAEFRYGTRPKKYQEELVSIIRDLEKIKSHGTPKINAYALYFLGVYYYKIGNFPSAKDKFVECSSLKSGSPIKESAKKHLDNLWNYQLKPPWWEWWLKDPLHPLSKKIIFSVLSLIIFGLLFPEMVIGYLSFLSFLFEKLLVHPLIATIYGTFYDTFYDIFSSVDWEYSYGRYALTVGLLLFILLSPSIYRIAGKDVEIEIQSPTLSSMEFYPEMPPFKIEHTRTIREIRKKPSITPMKMKVWRKSSQTIEEWI
ncbi:hypothetical protein MSMTP_0917 [Methanosarcina sp. MTP4]|uniref:tetratricopeptide repeat protein n=1 Tax=Methanosarcina sp. MTP4 TaxID=1434100 RepID=UPI000615BAB3|nr:tetratricopeptide repeat protein [Methanosarcina sp. MTP4]AKB24386.1 hypothetical protein MSMTP_0917 [Methanosarcina sp. MTP4]